MRQPSSACGACCRARRKRQPRILLKTPSPGANVHGPTPCSLQGTRVRFGNKVGSNGCLRTARTPSLLRNHYPRTSHDLHPQGPSLEAAPLEPPLCGAPFAWFHMPCPHGSLPVAGHRIERRATRREVTMDSRTHELTILGSAHTLTLLALATAAMVFGWTAGGSSDKSASEVLTRSAVAPRFGVPPGSL